VASKARGEKAEGRGQKAVDELLPSAFRPLPSARAGPLRLAFTRGVQDWWYGLIPFAVLNLVWLLAVVTVVAGPPATAAMLSKNKLNKNHKTRRKKEK